MFKRSGEIAGFHLILAGKASLATNHKESLSAGGK